MDLGPHLNAGWPEGRVDLIAAFQPRLRSKPWPCAHLIDDRQYSPRYQATPVFNARPPCALAPALLPALPNVLAGQESAPAEMRPHECRR